MENLLQIKQRELKEAISFSSENENLQNLLGKANEKLGETEVQLKDNLLKVERLKEDLKRKNDLIQKKLEDCLTPSQNNPFNVASTSGQESAKQSQTLHLIKTKEELEITKRQCEALRLQDIVSY